MFPWLAPCRKAIGVKPAERRPDSRCGQSTKDFHGLTGANSSVRRWNRQSFQCAHGELDRFVYVNSRDGEPPWAANGCYLAWRKIRENLPLWESINTSNQEQMIGRSKATGLPVSRQTTGDVSPETGKPMTPIYSGPQDTRDGALTAHIRKVQPRREGADLMGVEDLQRRFLRRGYPYFEGLDSFGQVSCGLLFLGFMRNLRKQFEWPVQNWQTNPDFPVPGTGIDALYGSGVLSNVDGGYYFCPAAATSPDDFVGSGLFG